jgi:hypothetical protein
MSWADSLMSWQPWRVAAIGAASRSAARAELRSALHATPGERGGGEAGDDEIVVIGSRAILRRVRASA